MEIKKELINKISNGKGKDKNFKDIYNNVQKKNLAKKQNIYYKFFL